MIRRTFAVAVAAVLTVSAAAAERDPRLNLRAMFEDAPGVADDAAAEAPLTMELIVARIDADGKLIKACVDSEAAARRFFDAPLETLENRKAKTQ